MRDYFLRSFVPGVTLCAALAALDTANAGPGPDFENAVAFFYGADSGPATFTPYAGAVISLDGSLAQSGPLFRTLGALSDFSYQSLAGRIDGRLSLADAMIGYQLVTTDVYAALYVGGEVRDYALSPHDPTNPVSGTEAGFKVAGTVKFPLREIYWIELMGSYSTAFDNYWVRERLGYVCRPFAFGPEFIQGGNLNHNEKRYGAFVEYKVPGEALKFTVAGGYHHSDDTGFFRVGDGAYGAVNISFDF
jgi:hypothetical protein